jgi:hypothetical protein
MNSENTVKKLVLVIKNFIYPRVLQLKINSFPGFKSGPLQTEKYDTICTVFVDHNFRKKTEEKTPYFIKQKVHENQLKSISFPHTNRTVFTFEQLF